MLKSLTFKNQSWLFFVIIFTSNLTLANELSDYCDMKDDTREIHYFKTAFKEAKDIKEKLCKHISSFQMEHLINISLYEKSVFYETGKKTVELYNYLKPFFSAKVQSKIDEIILSETIRLRPNIEIRTIYPEIVRETDVISLSGHAIFDASIPTCEQHVNQVVESSTCKNMLQEFEYIYSIPRNGIALTQARINRPQYSELVVEWESFYSDSKPQTFIERWLNGNRFQNKNTADGFVSPPNKQFIFLHPSIVVENLNSLSDGEQVKESFNLELFGVNWWKKNKWYQPSGISLNALYSDRPETEDFGYGISIHFKSKYSIGFSKHGSDDGIYFSLDLYELFKNKKEFYESYNPNPFKGGE